MAEQPHDRLKLLRKITGLKQRELAEVIDSNQSTLAGIEAGLRELSPQYAQRIANATGISTAWLYGEPGEESGALNVNKPAVDDAGNFYTQETFKRHAALKGETTEPAVVVRASSLDLGHRVDRLLRAAASANRGPSARQRIELAIREAMNDLGLKDAYQTATNHAAPAQVESDPHDLVAAGRDWAAQMLAPALLSELEAVGPEGDNSLRTRAIALFYYLDHLLRMKTKSLPQG